MRRTSACALAGLGLALSGLAVPTPAHATTTTVDTIEELQQALATCADGDFVVLGASISAPQALLTARCDVQLNLSSHDLTVRSVSIRVGRNLRVNSPTGDDTGGTLTADASASPGVPGIRTTDATLTTTGDAAVVALGGARAAGIGGGDNGTRGEDGGEVLANTDSSITATGGVGAAGIGGGSHDTTALPGGTGGRTVAGGTSTITATGGAGGAGIGGGSSFGSGGETIANAASTIVATGGTDAAGIGGGDHGAGGVTTSNADAMLGTSTIVATGDGLAAGIGGGAHGDAGSTRVTGGSSVTATGGTGGVGVGGGGGTGAGSASGGAGGLTEVVKGTLTATGGTSAVGSGSFRAGSPRWGSLIISNGGTLRLPSGTLEVVESGAGSEVAIAAGGRIDGSAGPTPTSGTLTGDGQVANHGAIALPTDHVDVTVSDHNYLVEFLPQGGSATPAPVQVFAPSFADGGRVFPAGPVKSGSTFAGWSATASGTGPAITATTDLGTINETVCSTPVPVTAYARYTTPRPSSAASPRATPQSGCISPPFGDPGLGVKGPRRVGKPMLGIFTHPGTAGTQVAWQWQTVRRAAGGGLVYRDIAGATDNEFVPTAAQAGLDLRVRLTLSAPHTADRVDYRTTGLIKRGRIKAHTVRVTGRLRVGQQVMAKVVLPSERPPGYQLTYQWRADGKPVAGGKAATLLIGKDLEGAMLSVWVTANAPGYLPKLVLTTPAQVQ